MLDSLPWPWPGHDGDGDDGGDQPAPQPRNFWVVYEDGVIAQLTVTGDGSDPVLSRPGRLITEAEYQVLQAQMLADQEARLAELLAAEEAQRLQDYTALIAVGIPDAVARSLSSYTGQAKAVAGGES
ncbi:hypothetical protein [Streptomyces misionensis]|uniref:hypothetical protein n=1 Tax=Streptomyces misionensis TaxID=67331 RepID=UPI0036BDF16C